MLLEAARRESFEAVNLSGRLSEECRGLRTDLHQQVSMVAQRDEVIRQLRDQAGAQWASGWLAFQQKAIRAYSDLDFNFDLPSDEEAEESFDTNESQEPGTPAKAPSHSSSSESLIPGLVSVYLMSTFLPLPFFLLGLGPNTYVALLSIDIRFLEICVLAELSLFFFLSCII